MSPHVLEKVPDHVGYLVINLEGAVIASGGQLENEDNIAKTIFSMVRSIDKNSLTLPGSTENFKKISINYENHVYQVCLSNRKINVVKKKYTTTKPIST